MRWTKPSSRSTEKGHMRARHQGEHIHRWHSSGEFARGQFSFYVIKGGISLLVSRDANIFPLSQRTRAWNSISFSRDSSLSLHLSNLGIATGDGVPQHGGIYTHMEAQP